EVTRTVVVVVEFADARGGLPMPGLVPRHVDARLALALGDPERRSRQWPSAGGVLLAAVVFSPALDAGEAQLDLFPRLPAELQRALARIGIVERIAIRFPFGQALHFDPTP